MTSRLLHTHPQAAEEIHSCANWHHDRLRLHIRWAPRLLSSPSRLPACPIPHPAGGIRPSPLSSSPCPPTPSAATSSLQRKQKLQPRRIPSHTLPVPALHPTTVLQLCSSQRPAPCWPRFPLLPDSQEGSLRFPLPSAFRQHCLLLAAQACAQASSRLRGALL